MNDDMKWWQKVIAALWALYVLAVVVAILQMGYRAVTGDNSGPPLMDDLSSQYGGP